MKRTAPAASATRLIRLDIEQMRLITKAARLHFIHGERQAEIAEKMGVSQASVSRLLTLAEEHGIVRTIVVPPEGLYPDLEDGLAEAYGLDAIHIVDVSSSEEGVAHVLGTAAARCLASELKSGSILGFTSWSTTLREMAKALEARNTSSVRKVVEMLGDLGSPMLQHEAALATLQMAKALDAEAVFLRTPGVMPNATLRQVAMSDVHVQAALRLLDTVDIAFVGVGPADFHGPLKEGDNFFSADQLADVRAAGAVGQLHQRFIDAQGQAVKTDLDQLVVGITLEQLRHARRRIVVAGGKDKHAALSATLAGRWIDVLVTDVNTANYLMNNAPKGRT
jgi:DNA-binding transcriptional regulator LsrR (DeoR family)